MDEAKCRKYIDEACLGCIYYTGDSYIKFCSYFEIAHTLRPCKPGKDCTVKTTELDKKAANVNPQSIKGKTVMFYAERTSRQEVQRLARLGFPPERIAERTGKSIDYVNYWTGQMKIKRQPVNVYHKINPDALKVEWMKGKSMAALAREFDVHKATVQRYATKWHSEGITRPKDDAAKIIAMKHQGLDLGEFKKDWASGMKRNAILKKHNIGISFYKYYAKKWQTEGIKRNGGDD